MLQSFRLLIVTGLAALTSACFVSDEALFDLTPGLEPVTPGLYMAYSFDADGVVDEEDIWRGEIDYDADGYLHSDTEDMPLEGAVFYPLSSDSWIIYNRGDEGNYLYVLVFRYPDGRIFGHLPECSGLSNAERERFGLSLGEHGRCQVYHLGRLVEIMETYIARNHNSMRAGTVMVPMAEPID